MVHQLDDSVLQRLLDESARRDLPVDRRLSRIAHLMGKYRAELVKPKAFVCLTEGYQASDALLADLLKACAAGLDVHKRPRWLEFVEALPRTATGKIQRFKLYEY